MLILTENGIIASRDYLGRTPIVIGKNEYGYATASESSPFPNLTNNRNSEGRWSRRNRAPYRRWSRTTAGSGQAHAALLFSGYVTDSRARI